MSDEWQAADQAREVNQSLSTAFFDLSNWPEGWLIGPSITWSPDASLAPLNESFFLPTTGRSFDWSYA